MLTNEVQPVCIESIRDYWHASGNEILYTLPYKSISHIINVNMVITYNSQSHDLMAVQMLHARAW